MLSLAAKSLSLVSLTQLISISSHYNFINFRSLASCDFFICQLITFYPPGGRSRHLHHLFRNGKFAGCLRGKARSVALADRSNSRQALTRLGGVSSARFLQSRPCNSVKQSTAIFLPAVSLFRTLRLPSFCWAQSPSEARPHCVGTGYLANRIHSHNSSAVCSRLKITNISRQSKHSQDSSFQQGSLK